MKAVEFYRKHIYALLCTGETEYKTESEIFEQAKEIEKEQMIKFAKHCLDKSIDLDILMAYNQVEIEYTNQTFKP